MAAREKFSVLLDDSVKDTKSVAFELPEWANYTAAFIPSIVNGDVSLEWISRENGNSAATLAATTDTNWHPVGDPTDGADAVICASGNDPMVVDISVFVRALAGNGYLRFVMSAQSSDVTFEVYVTGG